jgi:hypothetical protein
MAPFPSGIASANINVAAIEQTNITVAQRLMGSNIVLHCLTGPIRNPVPINDTIFPKVYTAANVLTFPKNNNIVPYCRYA